MAMHQHTVKSALIRSRDQVIPLEKVDAALGKPEPRKIVEPPALSAGALEARALIEKARQLKEQQEMATLGEQLRAKIDAAEKKEYLTATLNEWDEDEQKQIKGEIMQATRKSLFGISNNASRETFNYVLSNPGKTISEIKAALNAQGFKESTVTTLVYQMATAELFRKDNEGKFFAIKKEFEPFNISKLRRAAKTQQQAEDKAKIAAFGKRELSKQVVIVKRRTAEQAEAAHNANVAGIGALTVNAEQPTPAPARPRPWRPEDVVDQLTLAQAKEVHAYMQKVFGAL